MKQREIKQTITFRWWKTDKSDIKEAHIEHLEEHANNHITEMRVAGMTSGYLCEYVRTDDEDGEDGVEYSGWWEFSTETL